MLSVYAHLRRAMVWEGKRQRPEPHHHYLEHQAGVDQRPRAPRPEHVGQCKLPRTVSGRSSMTPGKRFYHFGGRSIMAPERVDAEPPILKAFKIT